METRTALVSAPGAIGVETRELPAPGEGEVIVRVAECGLCGSDLKLFSGRHPKLQPPLRLGHEFYGTVEAVGRGADGVEEGSACRCSRRSAAASATTAGAVSRTSAPR